MGDISPLCSLKKNNIELALTRNIELAALCFNFFFGNTDMSYRFYEVEWGVWVCDKGMKKSAVNT